MRKTYVIVLLASLVVSFLLYGNTISGEFVYDDNSYINHEDVKKAENLLKVWNQPLVPNAVNAGLFHPLTSFTYTLNFVLFGESPISFHIVNIFLNGLVSFLVFLLVKKLFNNTVLALFIALFYAFLPIHSEAVANIKGRDEIFAAVFGVSAWFSFLWATEEGDRIDIRKIFLSAFLFFLAVLSKVLIISLPALFLLAFIVRKKPSIFEIGKIAFVFFFILSIYMLWRFEVLGEYAFGKDVLFFAINPLAWAPFWTRLWTAFTIAFLYIGKTFIPWNLSASYHFNQVPLVNNLFESWQAIAGFLFLMVLIVLAAIRKTRATPAGLGALAFLVLYIVISKIIFKGGDMMAERWMYFPSMGLSFIGGYVMYSIYRRRKRLGMVLFIVVLFVYAAVLIPRNLVWYSEESLRRSMIKTAPRSIQGHYGLAQFYLERNLLDEAKKEAQIAYEIYNKHPPLLNTMGSIAFLEKEYARAAVFYLQAIEEAPFAVQGYQNAAKVYFTMGEYEKAASLLKYLITRWSHPRAADFVDYALVLAKQGKYQESLAVIQGRFKGDVKDSQIRLVLAIDYFKTGNLEEAKKYFDWNTSLGIQEKIKILTNF